MYVWLSFSQRRAIRRAQRSQSQPGTDQSTAERGQSQPGTDQSAAEGSQTSVLEQDAPDTTAPDTMATIPPESKKHMLPEHGPQSNEPHFSRKFLSVFSPSPPSTFILFLTSTLRLPFILPSSLVSSPSSLVPPTFPLLHSFSFFFSLYPHPSPQSPGPSPHQRSTRER